MKAIFRSGGLPDLIKALEQYVEPCKDYIFEISQSRTPEQNTYFHACIVPAFATVTGYTKRESKKMLCEAFLTYYKDGKPVTRSTSDLSTIQFEDFCQECRIWLYHNFNSRVPLPAEVQDRFINEFIIELEKELRY